VDITEQVAAHIRGLLPEAKVERRGDALKVHIGETAFFISHCEMCVEGIARVPQLVRRCIARAKLRGSKAA
jgi:hypothetical protein